MYLVRDEDDGAVRTDQVIAIDVPRHRAKKLVRQWENLDEEIGLYEYLIYEDYADVNPDFIHSETVRNASQNH